MSEEKMEVLPPGENFSGVKIFFGAAGDVQFEIKELSVRQLLKVAMSLDLVKNIFLQSVSQRIELDEQSRTDKNEA